MPVRRLDYYIMSPKARLPVAKNQHMVTKQYLRRWANDAGQVPVFDVRTGTVRRENISNVATQRYFYSGPDGEQWVEKSLAVLEGFWIEAQNRVLAAAECASRGGKLGSRVIALDDREQLAQGLVTQLVRTERVRRNLGDMPLEEAREAHAEFMTRPSVLTLAHRIENGIWLLRKNDLIRTAMPLYTSDHPVCVVPVDPEAPPTRYRVQCFMYPLAPAYLLAIYAPGITEYTKAWDGCLTGMEVTDVVESNALQLNSAERKVVSSSDDFSLAQRWFHDGAYHH